jgi:hypothetical protein
VHPYSGLPVRHILLGCVTLSAPLLALGVIYRQLVIGRVLAGGDLHLYFYPYWMAATRAFSSRTSLLWNPYLFGGTPLLANSQVGVLYPLNWPFWLLSTPALGAVAKALHGNVLLHLALAAVNAYVLTRMWISTSTSTPREAAGGEPHLMVAGQVGAAIAALIYAGSGFFAVHVEHLNQLQALAWLPLCFLPGRPVASSEMSAPLTRRTRALAVVAFAMILLAGHTQMAFIAALGLAIWYGAEVLETVWPAFPTSSAGPSQPGRPARTGRSWWRQVAVAVSMWVRRLAPFALAALLAGAQLVPSIELAQVSGRTADYAWREAVSFSVPPWHLPRALLPPYLTPPLLPEGVAHTGVLALVLTVLGAWMVFRVRRGIAPAVVALAGVFLATGGYNPLYLALVRVRFPGFAHFRAPARFLGLYVLGAAVLAGWGMAGIIGTRKRVPGLLLSGAIFLGLTLELWIGGQTLPYAAATTLRAYTDLRPATAHLVAAQAEEAGDPAGHRFLSISQTLFEVGDKEEVTGIYRDLLPADALFAYMVANKQREVLVPNLSLAFGVPAVDGYDGGLLPLSSYTAFSRLLLPEGTSDGRLRENLVSIPEDRWLRLMGVRHVLTDKTGDVWIEDVLYDRQFRPALAEGDKLRIAWLPDGFSANGLRLLYTGTGEVAIELLDGRRVRAPLPDSVEPDSAQQVEWEGATTVVGIEIQATGGALMLTGASLVDERLGSFYPLVLSDLFRLVHSGDVKIYETLSPPPRAFLVYHAETVTSESEALQIMAAEAFDPGERVVLMGGSEQHTGSVDPAPAGAPLRVQDEHVRVIEYSPTRVTLEVEAAHDGYLVLTDAWYPGWTARITTQPDAANGRDFTTSVRQADLLFRAVPVSRGRWRVTLSYTPWVIYAGLSLSLLGCVALGGYMWANSKHLRARDASRRTP